MDKDVVGEDGLIVEFFYVELLCVVIVVVIGRFCIFFMCYDGWFFLKN